MPYSHSSILLMVQQVADWAATFFRSKHSPAPPLKFLHTPTSTALSPSLPSCTRVRYNHHNQAMLCTSFLPLGYIIREFIPSVSFVECFSSDSGLLESNAPSRLWEELVGLGQVYRVRTSFLNLSYWNCIRSSKSSSSMSAGRLLQTEIFWKEDQWPYLYCILA